MWLLCPVQAEIFNRTSHLITGQSGSKPDTWQPYRCDLVSLYILRWPAGSALSVISYPMLAIVLTYDLVALLQIVTWTGDHHGSMRTAGSSTEVPPSCDVSGPWHVLFRSCDCRVSIMQYFLLLATCLCVLAIGQMCRMFRQQWRPS